MLLTTCEEDENPGLKPKDVMSILEEAGKVSPLAAEKDEVVESSVEESGGFRYTYEKHDVVDNIESITYLGLNDDIIWPGNLVKGDRAHDFIYEPISVDRAPVTLSISLESSSTGSSIVQEVENPRLSTVRQGISDLLKKAITSDTKVPAKVEFSHQQVFSQSQMNLFVKADVSYGAGDLSTQFSWDQTSTKNKIMAKYKQIYYSIDLDVPQSPRDFFASSVSVKDLEACITPGCRPLYVAGVSYGMMAIMCIETDYSYTEMKSALDAAYSGAVDVELDFGYTAKEVLESSSVKIIVYGGSTAGLDNIETGFEGFMDVVQASKDFTKDSPGVPLIYKFRHLVDNTLALVTLTSQYTLVSPLRLEQWVTVTAKNFVCTMADDEGSDNTVDMDRFYVWANAFNRTNSVDPGVQFNPVNQEVYGYSTSGEISMDPGDIHEANSSIDLAFDTENYDFNFATLKLKAYARDYDGIWSSDETATGEITLIGNDIWGDKKIYLYSDDFTFEVNIAIRKSNKK
ncbi:MAG: thiol-activated cytolysin family protein [Bacteroidales bacterium]|nr:thiol-activated cytolysin family protein [Bacteroidales bacterium]